MQEWIKCEHQQGRKFFVEIISGIKRKISALVVLKEGNRKYAFIYSASRSSYF